MIIFVYDNELVQSEEDDPSKALLYFHPGWVSDQQRISLSGQIIGTSNFLQSVFKSPRIIALHSGKFSIRTYGRYILVHLTVCHCLYMWACCMQYTQFLKCCVRR